MRGTEARNLFLLATISVVAANELQERVWIEDLNSDHDRRHLEAGLPSSLKFNLKRQSGNIELTLEKNSRVNLATPVYVLKTDANGEMKLVKKKTEPLRDINFYHDKRSHGAFSVKCQRVQSGPCVRMITGNLLIENRHYGIEPAQEVAYKRGFEGHRAHAPHVLTEIKLDPNTRYEGQFEADFIQAPGDEREMGNYNRTEKVQTGRQKRATNTYAVEIFMVADTTVWNRYYALTEATATLDKSEATELYLRQRYSFILNGISLRYESIEDPDMAIYCTVIGFLFLQTRDSTNPLPLGHEETIKGKEYADASTYLSNLGTWSQELDIQADHVMTFTHYELYTDFTNDTAVAGKAYVGRACTPWKVSVVEDTDFFATTSAASHELGHSLNAWHDGSYSSSACDPYDEYVMAPWVVLFTDSEPYSLNPWRFSQCSINAFKSYIDMMERYGTNCLTDPGNFYNHQEYLLHISKEPGELHDADSQCQLILGESSKLCTNTDPDKICLVMKCLNDGFYCRYYSAARGTECGGANSNKWCQEGACVEREVETTPVTSTSTSTSTTPTTTTTTSTAPPSTTSTTPTTTTTIPPSTTSTTPTTTTTIPPTTTSTTPTTTTTNPPTSTSTTPTTTTANPPTTTTTTVTVASTSSTEPPSSQCLGDVGFDVFTCSQLKDMLGNSKLCKNFAQECCATCGPKCHGNKNIKLSGVTYSCEAALAGILQNSLK